MRVCGLHRAEALGTGGGVETQRHIGACGGGTGSINSFIWFLDMMGGRDPDVTIGGVRTLPFLCRVLQFPNVKAALMLL